MTMITNDDEEEENLPSPMYSYWENGRNFCLYSDLYSLVKIKMISENIFDLNFLKKNVHFKIKFIKPLY